MIIYCINGIDNGVWNSGPGNWIPNSLPVCPLREQDCTVSDDVRQEDDFAWEIRELVQISSDQRGRKYGGQVALIHLVLLVVGAHPPQVVRHVLQTVPVRHRESQ